MKELLGDADLSDAEVVSWADEVRRERKESAPWHYVAIPADADGYDPKIDRGGNNVMDAIERFAKILVDKKAPKEDRIEALKFLVHFVGDIHQPLHRILHDRSGNVTFNTVLLRRTARQRERHCCKRACT